MLYLLIIFSRSTVKYFVWCLIMPGWEPILMKYWKAAGRMAWLRGRGSQGHIRYVADSLWTWRKGVGVCVCVWERVTRHTRTRNTNDEICMKLTFLPSQNHGICIARLEPLANSAPETFYLPAATMTSYCCCCCCCYCNCCFGVM